PWHDPCVCMGAQYEVAAVTHIGDKELESNEVGRNGEDTFHQEILLRLRKYPDGHVPACEPCQDLDPCPSVSLERCARSVGPGLKTALNLSQIVRVGKATVRRCQSVKQIQNFSHWCCHVARIYKFSSDQRCARRGPGGKSNNSISSIVTVEASPFALPL